MMISEEVFAAEIKPLMDATREKLVAHGLKFSLTVCKGMSEDGAMALAHTHHMGESAEEYQASPHALIVATVAVTRGVEAASVVLSRLLSGLPAFNKDGNIASPDDEETAEVLRSVVSGEGCRLVVEAAANKGTLEAFSEYLRNGLTGDLGDIVRSMEQMMGPNKEGIDFAGIYETGLAAARGAAPRAWNERVVPDSAEAPATESPAAEAEEVEPVAAG